MLYHSLKYAFIIAVLLSLSQSLYTPYYKRCRLNQTKIDAKAIAIADLQIQKVAEYYTSYYIEPVIFPELELQYQQFNFYYHEFIGSGGSGEVYLVEDQKTQEGKILKRFFKENDWSYRLQNFIMKRLNYQIKWSKDCQMQDCLPNATKFHTVAIFPHKQSIVMRQLQFDGQELALIFYKILKELDRLHRSGICHHDMKLGNILVNSKGADFKFYEAQIIDWNIANFYFKGYDEVGKHGTMCYYAPQQLLLGNYLTPAIDIWSLGVVMYTYITDQKPFITNCKDDNLMAIGSLVGGRRLLNVYKKYNYYCPECIQILKIIEANPDKYPPRTFESFKPKMHAQYLTADLYEVLARMFEPDPQLRATAEQLLKMKYFQNARRLPPIYFHHDKTQKKDKDKEREKIQKEMISAELREVEAEQKREAEKRAQEEGAEQKGAEEKGVKVKELTNEKLQ